MEQFLVGRKIIFVGFYLHQKCDAIKAHKQIRESGFPSTCAATNVFDRCADALKILYDLARGPIGLMFKHVQQPLGDDSRRP